MRTNVSVVALAAALLATSPAAAQISLDVGNGSLLDLGVSVGGSDGLNVGVDVGASDGLNVDAGVGLGGSEGVNVDAGVGVGGSEGLLNVDAGASAGGDGGINVDADAAVGGADGLDADVNLGTSSTGPNGGPLISIGGGEDEVVGVAVGSSGGGEPVGTRISTLGETARLDALLGQIGDPQLADVDLDAVINDRAVSILEADALLGEDQLAVVIEALGSDDSGRVALLDAVRDSTVLTSLLGAQGLAVEDVLSVAIDSSGATEVVVLGASEGAEGGLLGADALADADIDLLSDEEVAELDLALLPSEEQRVNALLRLLPRDGSGAGDDTGTTRIIELNALLGEEGIGTVTNALGGGDPPELDAELVARLQALGIDPEAVVAIGTDGAGNENIFLDTTVDLAGIAGNGQAGDIADPLAGLTQTELANLDVDLLTDEEVGLIDLSLLPNEEQRVDAVLRLLGSGSTPDSSAGAGSIEVVNLAALLGEESLADVTAVLGNEDSVADATVNTGLDDVLQTAGIDPSGVVALRLGRNNALRAFINPEADSSAGDGAGAGDGSGGTGGGAGSGTGDGGAGGEDGSDGTDAGQGGDSANGGDGNDDSGSNGGSIGGNDTDDDIADDSATGSETGDQETGVEDGLLASAVAGPGGARLTGVAGQPIPGPGLFADLSCATGLAGMGSGETISASAVASASSLELVRLIGCDGSVAADNAAQVRAAIEANADVVETLQQTGVPLEAVVGARLSGDIVTVYVVAEYTVT